MSLTVSKDALNELMDLQEDLASSFSEEHFLPGKTYWTCIECLAQTKLAELDDKIVYTANQRFE